MGPAAIAAAHPRGRSATRRSIFSFDIDALDPAFAPGTGTPEIGGLASWQVQAILRAARRAATSSAWTWSRWRRAYDVAEITALAGATMVWEYLALLAR